MQNYNAYTIFADESGTDNIEKFSQDDRYFVLAFCLFDKNYYTQTAIPSFQKLKFETFGYDQIVIHGYDMMNCLGDFECLQDKKLRTIFLNRLNEIIEATHFVLIATVIDKQKLKEKYTNPKNPYELAMQYSLERIYKFMIERKQQNKITHICIESRGKVANQKLESAFSAIKNGSNWNKQSFPFEIKFIDKRTNSTGLQFADLVADPIRCQHLRPHKIHPNFVTLQNKFYCKGGRCNTGEGFQGFGLKVFP